MGSPLSFFIVPCRVPDCAKSVLAVRTSKLAKSNFLIILMVLFLLYSYLFTIIGGKVINLFGIYANKCEEK